MAVVGTGPSSGAGGRPSPGVAANAAAAEDGETKPAAPVVAALAGEGTSAAPAAEPRWGEAESGDASLADISSGLKMESTNGKDTLDDFWHRHFILPWEYLFPPEASRLEGNVP
uniref:Uncharacterized protein n=1 Tax=Oryctolagus cuniculus TaxID=9986 RepID=A0A5F9DG42_RABIT